MKTEWLYAAKGGWTLFGPALFPLPAARDGGTLVTIREPVRVDTVLVPGPPGLDPTRASIGSLSHATPLLLPWATVRWDEVLWHGDPEADPRMAPLYRMYHQAITSHLRRAAVKP